MQFLVLVGIVATVVVSILAIAIDMSLVQALFVYFLIAGSIVLARIFWAVVWQVPPSVHAHNNMLFMDDDR